MVHKIDAIYDHGVFQPTAPLPLPEGTRVHLRVEETTSPAEQAAPTASEHQIPTLLERMKGFVGTVNDLPEDSSVNLDHYLYGTPKRK